MRKPEDEKTTHRSVTMPRNLWEAAREHAERERRSVSNVVALAVSAYLQGAQRDAQA